VPARMNLGICGGACGGDLLFAEGALAQSALLEIAERNGSGVTAISCGKSESKVSFAHEQSCASGRPSTGAPIPAPHNTTPKTARKKLWRFMPRNPLKSLDSRERIQGNPRKSNPHNRGFRSETAGGQENPNGSTGTAARSAARKEPTQLRQGKAIYAASCLST
jgi:hypothetical protein